MPARELQLQQRSTFAATAQELYDWHARPGALARLLPPWDRTEVVACGQGLEIGNRVRLRLHLGPLTLPFTACHLDNQPGHMFRDAQERGPFARWDHRHLFFDSDAGGVLEDQVRYRLPAQALLPHWLLDQVQDRLHRLFIRRHRVLAADLAQHRLRPRPLRILISGASGVLGRALIPLLTTGGHQIWTLTRNRDAMGEQSVYWNPMTGRLDPQELPTVDAVIHLAGEAIGLSRWSAAKKQRVAESRALGTALLAQTLAALPHRPEVLLSASAVGYYGDCRQDLVDEAHPPGRDFISRVCIDWEAATGSAAAAGIRTVLLRIGVVLTPRGGGLQRMTKGPRPCYISRFGHGRQPVSWIHIDDAIGAILHCLYQPRLSGPVNLAAPHPVSNATLMATLARVQARPCFPPLPAWLLRALFGQMASEVVLAGCRVSVDKLLDSGYHFRHPQLEPALRDLLGKT